MISVCFTCHGRFSALGPPFITASANGATVVMVICAAAVTGAGDTAVALVIGSDVILMDHVLLGTTSEVSERVMVTLDYVVILNLFHHTSKCHSLSFFKTVCLKKIHSE